MLNFKIILRVLSSVVFVEALMMAVCIAVACAYGESHWHLYFGLPAIGATALGLLFHQVSRNARNKIGRRDGYFLVVATWLLLALIGALPFMISGVETRFSCAFFELVSGFTTTGASAMSSIENVPHSLLLFRSLTHWIGGLGIVFFTLVLLPSMNSSDMRLLAAEATGVQNTKLHSHVSTTARWLWGVNILLTTLCALGYYLFGMDAFQAVNHAFSTIGTGGFSTEQNSIAAFHSPEIECIAIVFMFLASINFSLFYLLLIKRKIKKVFADAELRCFFFVIVGAILSITTLRLFQTDVPFIDALRSSAFAVVSLQSTTGFVSEDYMLWPVGTHIFLLLVTIVGGCAGSTAGGIKCIRVLTSFKVLRNEFKHILHPKAIYAIRINGSDIGGTIIRSIFAFFIAYMILLFFSILVFGSMGATIYEAFAMAVTLISNSGPAVGKMIGATGSWDVLPDLGVWFGSFLMLAGRLEIFTLILPFIPSFWRDK